VRAYRAGTLTELHQGMCEAIVNAPKDQLDVITSVDVQIHNVIGEAQRMEWEFDLKDMWLTPSRWTMMLNQYLDPPELQAWLERTARLIGPGGRGISMMRTKTVAPRGGPAKGNKETRRWGSCMLALSYKAVPAPQITLYSRTSYLGYLAALDLSVAWMCGRYLAREMGMAVEDFKFCWMNEAVQYHHFKSLAYFLNHPEPKKRARYRHLILEKQLGPKAQKLVDKSPALIYSRKWMQKLLKEDADGLTLGDMSYNTYRRIRRRFHTEVMGYDYAQKYEGWSHYKQGPNQGERKEFFKAYQPLPHTPVEKLDFSRIGLPFDGLAPVDYDARAAEEAMEEDD
jgi:hypothetical protein